MKPDGCDCVTDLVLKRLADSDHDTLILARRLQARGPHTEGATTTQTAPKAIREQLIPGHAQPLHNQPSEALKPRSSSETQGDGAGRPKSTPILSLITPRPECAFKADGPQEVGHMSQVSSSPDPAFLPCAGPLLRTSDISQPRQPILFIGSSSTLPNPPPYTEKTPKSPNTDRLTELQTSVLLQSPVSYPLDGHSFSEGDCPNIK